MIGPQTVFGQTIHLTKYRSAGETFQESANRQAGSLCDNPEHFQALQDIYYNQRFLNGGRVQASAGAAKIVSPINCFMSGDIEDSFVDGNGNIMQRATEAAGTMRLGGGIGTNFSTLRPSGDLITSMDTQSSGAVSFMEIFNAVGKTVASSGHRRGAQMGVMRVDHPDIELFIHAKNDQTTLTGFNMSVLVTDEFMRAVDGDLPFDLRFDGTIYNTISARNLWDMIMRSNYDWGEPGVLFIDQIQRENNLAYCETITGTNPCGEIPLPPFGACLLGSFNLTKYVKDDRSGLNLDQLIADVPHVVRALDNVIDTAPIWPMPEQEQEMKSKRRIGIGVTGLANALEALDCPYASKQFINATKMVLRTLRDACYEASVDLAIEKGAFPLFDAGKYGESPYIQRLDPDLQARIAEHGIRNSHLLALAPTGTISMAADNVSASMEPVFALEGERPIQTFDGPRIENVKDYGYWRWGVRGKTAGELTPDEHVDVLAACTPFMDQSISKTINMPKDISFDDFKGVYMRCWVEKCKGCTIFRDDCKRVALLTKKVEANEVSACDIDPVTGRMECS